MPYPHKCVGYRGRKCGRVTYLKREITYNPLCRHCRRLYETEPEVLAEILPKRSPKPRKKRVAKKVKARQEPTLQPKVKHTPASPLSAFSGDKLARKVNEYLRGL